MKVKKNNSKRYHSAKMEPLTQNDLQDGINPGWNRGQLDSNAVTSNRKAQLRLVGEEANLFNALSIQGQIQGVVLEVEDMDIEGVVALSGHSPVMGRNHAATGAIDALAVDAHPFAQSMEALNGLDGQAPVTNLPV